MCKPLPLTGKSILVTRGKDQAKEFSTLIKEAGGIPIEIPLISFKLPDNQSEVRQTIKSIDTYDWLVFTSKNGVKFFFDVYSREKPLPKIAAVGAKTEAALKEYGYIPEVVPSDYVAEGLICALEPLINKDDSILLARGNLSRSILATELSKKCGNVHDLIIYDTVENNNEKQKLIELLSTGQLDVLTFTSSSTVTSFLKLVNGTAWREWIQNLIIACIGPVTKQALEVAKMEIHVCPNTYTTEDMLLEITNYMRRNIND
jgi:uroporphyrinogen-III synthase